MSILNGFEYIMVKNRKKNIWQKDDPKKKLLYLQVVHGLDNWSIRNKNLSTLLILKLIIWLLQNGQKRHMEHFNNIFFWNTNDLSLIVPICQIEVENKIKRTFP